MDVEDSEVCSTAYVLLHCIGVIVDLSGSSLSTTCLVKRGAFKNNKWDCTLIRMECFEARSRMVLLYPKYCTIGGIVKYTELL